MWVVYARDTPADHQGSPAKVVDELAGIHCDPEVALRLAFLEVSHRPRAQSVLAKDTPRQQRIKRKLRQARKKVLDAAQLLEEARSDAPHFIFVTPEVRRLRSALT
jgi:hypothetical protein